MPYLLVLMALCSEVSTGGFSVFLGIGVLVFLRDFFCHPERLHFPARMKQVLYVYLAVAFGGACFSYEPGVSFAAALAEVFRLMPFVLALLYLRSWRQIALMVLAFGLSTLLNDAKALGQVAQFGFAGGYRPGGFANHPVFLGSFMLMSIPVLMLLPERLPLSHRGKYFLWGTGVLAFVTLLLTQTRGAWLAFIGTFAVLLLLVRRGRRPYLRLAAGAVALALVFGQLFPALSLRADSIDAYAESSSTERYLMWQSAFAMWQDYPVFGVGHDVYGLFYNTKYISPLAKERANPVDPRTGHGHPHNNFLKVLAEQGVVGFAAYLLLHGFVLFALLRQFRRKSDGGDRAAALAALTGVLVLLGVQMEGLTDTNMNLTHITRCYWLLLGLCLAGSRLPAMEATHDALAGRAERPAARSAG